MRKSGKIWETTKEPNVLRNSASGRYYARYTIAGKQKWTNLKTDHRLFTKGNAWR